MTKIATPAPQLPRTVVRGYRSFAAAKHAHDVCQVVGHIPDRRMALVARGLAWREPLGGATLVRLCASAVATSGAAVALVLRLLGLAAENTGWLTQAVCGALTGVAAGALAAAVLALARSQRAGLVPTGHAEPTEYDLPVEGDLVPVAREVLQTDS